MIEDFVKANDFKDFPIKVLPIYRDENHICNNFGELYHKNAEIYVHKDLMIVTLIAALYVHKKYGYKLQINDSLRTVDAQIKMEAVAIKNSWNEDMVSRPESGMHPKGLAIDVELLDNNGNLIDMGAKFDEFSPISDKFHNKAHRKYVYLSAKHKKRRRILDDAMLSGAKIHKVDLLLLESEWWDFRFKSDIFKINPVYDKDLPIKMRQIKENLILDEVLYDDKIYENNLRYIRKNVHF